MPPSRCRMRITLASPKPYQSVWPPHVCWARKFWKHSPKLSLIAFSSGTLSEPRVCFLLHSLTQWWLIDAIKWHRSFAFLWNCWLLHEANLGHGIWSERGLWYQPSAFTGSCHGPPGENQNPYRADTPCERCHWWLTDCLLVAHLQVKSLEAIAWNITF